MLPEKDSDNVSSCVEQSSDENSNIMLTEKNNDKVPIWLKLLLNDDIHTGRNVGAKLAYLCPDSASDGH